jgi:hypothetical protein
MFFPIQRILSEIYFINMLPVLRGNIKLKLATILESIATDRG